jgi:hypothetical protein
VIQHVKQIIKHHILNGQRKQLIKEYSTSSAVPITFFIKLVAEAG